jgi:flagellar basal body-associated protein FliL
MIKIENKFGSRAKGKAKTGVVKIIIAILIFLILLVIFLVPVLMSSQKGREIILAKVDNSTGGKANFADLSMGWFRGIRIRDFSFSDKAGQIAASAKQISANPHYLSLLVGGLSVDLAVNDGNVKVTSSQSETVELSQINTQVNLRPPGKWTTFNLDMEVADKTGQSKISAEGNVSPNKKAGWSLKGASGNLSVDVNELDIASLKPIFAIAGVDVQANGIIGGVLKGELENGRLKNLNADIKGKNLDVTAGPLKGDRFKTGVLNARIELKDSSGLMNIGRFDVHSDWADVNASGVVPTTLSSLADFTKPDSPYNLKGNFACDLAAVLSQMPHTLGLKETVKMTSGRLSGDVETFSGDGRKGIRSRSNLIGLEGTVDGKKVTLSEPVNAEAEVTSDEGGIKIDKLDVSASFAKIRCSGNSQLLNCGADVDLAKFQSELGQFVNTGPYKLAGIFTGKAEVSIKEEKIAAAGTSTVKDFRLTSTDGSSAFEPAADLNFNAVVDRKENVLDIDSLKLAASFGEVSTKAAVLPLGEKAAKPVNLPVSAHIDLQKIQPFAVMLASFPKEMQLAGMVDSEVSLSAEKNNYKIVTDATKIRNLRIAYPQQQPFEQAEVSLAADIRFNPDDKTYTVKLQLTSPQIKIKGNINQATSGGNTKLDGQANCEYDWAAISTMAAPYLPAGLKLKGQRKDNISFASEYPSNQPDKLVENLNTAAKLGFDSAEYMGLNVGPTEVSVQVSNGLLKIAPFSTTVNNGQLNFAGEANFKGQPKVFRTPGPLQIVKDIQINDATTRQMLMYVNPIFSNAVNVSGVANFYCEKLVMPLSGGSKNDIVVIGTVSIDRLKLQASDFLGQLITLLGSGGGMDIVIHPTYFVLQNGFLKYDNMQMDIGNKPVNFKGIIGMDKSLNMTVTLPYTVGGKTVRVGQEQAAGRASLPITGTLDKPQLDVGKFLQEQAIQKGMELLLGGVKKKR